MKKLYTVMDVVELTGLSRRTIYRHMEEGKLQGMKIVGSWRFTEEQIQAYIKGE